MTQSDRQLATLGLGGLGLLMGSLAVMLFSTRGRRILRSVAAHLEDAPSHFEEWNEAAQRELERIQNALDKLASSLQYAD